MVREGQEGRRKRWVASSCGVRVCVRERDREREICALAFSEFATCAHGFFDGFKVVKEMECEILKTRTNCARN
jgi:hypothetical protein